MENNEKIIEHFHELIVWTEDAIEKTSNDYTYHRLMKLKEALDSIAESLVSTISLGDSQLLAKHQETFLKTKAYNVLRERFLLRQGMIQVPLPMLF